MYNYETKLIPGDQNDQIFLILFLYQISKQTNQVFDL